MLGLEILKSSILSLISKSFLIVTKILLNFASSEYSIKRFLTLSFSSFSKFLYKFSIDPYSLISGAAVLGPIPLTPGMLSIESPTKAKKSIIDPGFKSYFSWTSLMLVVFPFIVSIIFTFLSINWTKSLSPEIIEILFLSLNFSAIDPIKSSAS